MKPTKSISKTRSIEQAQSDMIKMLWAKNARLERENRALREQLADQQAIDLVSRRHSNVIIIQ